MRDVAEAAATAPEPWLGVEVRHLAALAAISRTGSFRGAADELGYVQSAISQQLAFLEQLVGIRLVERSRGNKRVVVTEAGELLLAHADRILARLRAARADIDALERGDRGSVRLGVSRGVVVGLLPRILAGVAARTPDIEVQPIETADEAPLFDLIEEGRLEIVVAGFPSPPGALDACELTTDSHVLVVPADSPLARARVPVRLEQVARLPLIVHTAFPYIESHLESHGSQPTVVYRSAASASVEAMVAGGIGVAIVPGLAVGPAVDGTVRLDVGHLIPPRTVGLFWNRERRLPRAVDALRDVIRAVCTPETDQTRIPLPLAS
jgi:molybdate transport repressor ModE-like protein